LGISGKIAPGRAANGQKRKEGKSTLVRRKREAPPGGKKHQRLKVRHKRKSGKGSRRIKHFAKILVRRLKTFLQLEGKNETVQ